MPQDVILLKLGGSLLTDKTAIETARPATLARLAAEIAAGRAVLTAQDRGLVVAHGSGSFGHVAAQRHGIAAGLRARAGAGGTGSGTGNNAGGDDRDAADQLRGVSHTQERAAALHWQVVAALAAAGLAPFSLAPSSSVVSAGRQPQTLAVEPLLLALHHGLLPVLYGDVVLDRQQGVAICSTEKLFVVLVHELAVRGVAVRRILWLGETDGVLDAAGHMVPTLDDATLRTLQDPARPAIGGANGTDVTGGMLHRVETALALAGQGVGSLIANGTTPGLLAAALRGEAVAGTEVPAAPVAAAPFG